MARILLPYMAERVGRMTEPSDELGMAAATGSSGLRWRKSRSQWPEGLRDWLVPTTAAAFGTLRTKAAAAFRDTQR
jgi:hypothetical protein